MSMLPGHTSGYLRTLCGDLRHCYSTSGWPVPSTAGQQVFPEGPSVTGIDTSASEPPRL